MKYDWYSDHPDYLGISMEVVVCEVWKDGHASLYIPGIGLIKLKYKDQQSGIHDIESLIDDLS